MRIAFYCEGQQIRASDWGSPPRVGDLFSLGHIYTVVQVEWVADFVDAKGFTHKGPHANIYLTPGGSPERLTDLKKKKLTNA